MFSILHVFTSGVNPISVDPCLLIPYPKRYACSHKQQCVKLLTAYVSILR